MSSQTDQSASHNDTSDDDHLPARRDDGTVAMADDPFADPGLPPHEPRRQDIDERAAKRSERTVAFLFTLSMLATVGFIVSYVAIPIDEIVYIWPIGHISGLNFALGLTLAVALFCIGAGAIHWARTLMSDVEVPEERHAIEATPDVKAHVLEEFAKGAEESQFGRRKLVRNTMFGALALVPLTGLVLLRDTGPLPGNKLQHTAWKKGSLIINESTLQPLRPEDITVGSLTQAMPEGLDPHAEDFHAEIAKAAVMLVRLEPEDIKDPRSAEWGHEGILCYSKICTHIGCPATLYEQQTHHALCPCHQSTFDLADGARVLFGPAGHPLPQLRITVNDEGFLEALGDFDEPPGPSYWERG
ncbi:cytochrome bc1 complex Rieske iron-sulfur subunit [Streptomyces litchfieldiae]|uniref:Cytochrome bc1 complex Rieske iron-sulfur subunit n=2 Tax=Streptomyces litchfieldiae TaxID=3075543 RepID=A0ABU2MSR6_9ACTN|nr:Rieske 2Fe-2S domain-containing protein [Streptomyces sp. DSM 44938]MDT0344677.1 Rieske 2Fe-2S domain-containing protein [Streptomyces sp. DSM 44938]